ncbi:MAG TPA: hypothetical protein VMR59_02225 [Patescibacteria group bacterium]|jgi:hypothetical protein|nr:hypothetical protein [Patescibacteria group bacterium]
MREKRGMNNPARTTYGDGELVRESPVCRLYPLLPGFHSSADADALAAQEMYDGELPADADQADLGLPIRLESVRDQREF